MGGEMCSIEEAAEKWICDDQNFRHCYMAVTSPCSTWTWLDNEVAKINTFDSTITRTITIVGEE